MAPSGAIHPLGSAFLTIRPPTRAFYDEDDTDKGSSGNGVLLKVADPVIRRVTTRPQSGNRCGYGAALPLHDEWVPSRSVRPQRFQAAAPGLVGCCAAHYRTARGTGPLGPHPAPAPSRRTRLLRPQCLQRPAPPKPSTAAWKHYRICSLLHCDNLARADRCTPIPEEPVESLPLQLLHSTSPLMATKGGWSEVVHPRSVAVKDLPQRLLR